MYLGNPFPSLTIPKIVLSYIKYFASIESQNDCFATVVHFQMHILLFKNTYIYSYIVFKSVYQNQLGHFQKYRFLGPCPDQLNFGIRTEFQN